MRIALSTAVLALAWSAPALATDFGSGDINYLANLREVNKPYFESNINGVSRFSGTGVVSETHDLFGDPHLLVDMGSFGQALCQRVSPGIKDGDKVVVSGSIGGAMTARTIAEDNKAADLLNNPKGRWPEKDLIYLIGDTCVARKVG